MTVDKANREYRSVTGFGLSDSTEYQVEGYAIVFESTTALYKDSETGLTYYEVIDRSALDGVDLSDVILNVNHNVPVIARTRNKSLELSVDSKGLKISAVLNGSDTAKDIYNSVRSGLYQGMSFSFTIAKDGDAYDAATRTRRITQIDRIFDVSIVDIPAYGDTYVYARSKLAEYAEPDRRAYRMAEVKTIQEEIISRASSHADPYPELYVGTDDRTIVQRKMAEILCSVSNSKGSDDVPLARKALESIQSLENELISLHEERTAIREAVANGAGTLLRDNPCADNTNRKDNTAMIENNKFYSGLVEKRAANNVSGMGNVIPSDIIGSHIREGKNGLYDDISITSIPHSGNIKIPYIADSDLTVNAHTENNAITPAGTVPSYVTITHGERECTLGYSYLGKLIAISEFENIMNNALIAGMRRKLDSDAVAAVKALTWTSGTNAKAWASSGAPKLIEILALMKMLPERYANGAKLYMNRATSLAIIENSAGTAYKSDDSAATNGMFNVSVVNGLESLFGVSVVIDSNVSSGDVLYGNAAAVHMNFAGDVVLNNWLDHDSLTEKMQIACAVGAACEPAAFVLGANSLS